MTGEINEYIKILDKYLPVVVRVHGKEHPELKDVFDAYKDLKEQLLKGEAPKDMIMSIRSITGNYELPEDACQAYTKVYNTLSEIDKAFN